MDPVLSFQTALEGLRDCRFDGIPYVHLPREEICRLACIPGESLPSKATCMKEAQGRLRATQ